MDLDDLPEGRRWHDRAPEDPREDFQWQIAAFGEAVLFKPHRDGGHLMKSAPQWRDGVWLGFNSRTHEHIVSDEGDIVHCRTIHRKPPENI